MMRIAYVSTDPGIPVFGCKGASVHVQEMVRAFIASGAEVTLFSSRMEDPPPEDLATVRCHPLPKAPKGDPEQRSDALIDMNTDVRQALEDAGPFDLVYERHALFADAAMEYARSALIPSVLEVNAPLIDEQSRHRSLARLDDAIFRALRACTVARHVVAVSPEVADYAKSLGAAPALIDVIPNAVNPARFKTAARFEGPFRVGFLGTLKPWHDVALIVDAFALLRATIPDAELLIVGDGPERRALEAKIEAYDLSEAVKFTGTVTAADVPGWLARMHVGLATYRGSDPFYFSPLKLYEYMAAGLPALVSRVGKLPEVIAVGITGISVEPDDAAALASTLADLAKHPDRIRAIGKAARETVLATHTWDRVAARIFYRAGLRPALNIGAA